MSSERRRDRRDDRDDDDEAGHRSRQRQRRDRDDDHHHHGGGGGGRSYDDNDRRRHHRQGNASSLSSGLRKDRDADEGLTFETSPGIVAVKSFEMMGLRVREILALERRKETAAAAFSCARKKKGGGGKKEQTLNLDPVSFALPTTDKQDDLLRGIYGHGFEKPSAIQARALPAIIGDLSSQQDAITSTSNPSASRRDVIAQAQSGTGKTSMIALASCALADPRRPDCQVLILSPTRELATQTERVAGALGEHAAVRVMAAVGGASAARDARELEGGGKHVVSGTPGRVFDMISRGALKTAKVRTLILDEADELLAAGFRDQIFDIYRRLPASTQTVLVSATLQREVLEMAEKFMAADPLRILMRRDNLTLEGIRQFSVRVEKEEWKFETLCDLYDSLTISQAVVFCNSRKKVDWLAAQLCRSNFTVSSMHGELPQRERDSVMASFRGGESRVLVTTDVWARGIDVAQVSLVVNYDMPPRREAYLHRIGRSGRFGRKGVAISFATDDDSRVLRAIEQFYKVRIPDLPANVGDLL